MKLIFLPIVLNLIISCVSEFTEDQCELFLTTSLDNSSEYPQECLEAAVKINLKNDVLALSPTQTDDERFADLRQWLIEGGAKIEGVESVAYQSGYRGLHASSDLIAGELILNIPLSHCMLPSEFLKTPLGHVMASKNYTSPENDRQLTLAYLITERFKPSSFWIPYLRSLPLNFSTIAYWENADVDLLNGSCTLSQTTSYFDDARTYYNTLVERIPEFSVFSFELYHWAYTIAATRAFGIFHEGIHSEVLIPLGDMFNHRPYPPDAAWGFPENGNEFHVTMNQNISKGTPINVDYGSDKSQIHYLSIYGFLQATDWWNEVWFPLTIPTNDRNYENKVQRLGDSYSCTLTYDYTKPATLNCLSWARRATFDGPGWTHFPEDVGPISWQNEKSALNLITQHARTFLATFPTTWEQDLALVQSSLPPFSNRDNALHVLASEKIMASFYIDLTILMERLSHHLETLAGVHYDSSQFRLEGEVNRWVNDQTEQNYLGTYFRQLLHPFWPIL